VKFTAILRRKKQLECTRCAIKESGDMRPTYLFYLPYECGRSKSIWKLRMLAVKSCFTPLPALCLLQHNGPLARGVPQPLLPNFPHAQRHPRSHHRSNRTASSFTSSPSRWHHSSSQQHRQRPRRLLPAPNQTNLPFLSRLILTFPSTSHSLIFFPIRWESPVVRSY
jgi:hypothetical protein